MAKIIEIKTEVGVMVFAASAFAENLEEERRRLINQVEEGVVLLDPTIKFVGCFGKGAKKE